MCLSVWGLSSEGVEQYGRSEALFSDLQPHLSFLDHVYELDADKCVLRCLERFEPEHRPCDPFDGSVVLFHEVIEIFGLADNDRSAMFLVVALDRRFVGRTPIDRNGLGYTPP